MFEKGDLVTYGCKGVCEVKNITTLNLEGIPKDRLYYEMQSMVNAGSRIFSPVGQEEKNAARLSGSLSFCLCAVFIFSA